MARTPKDKSWVEIRSRGRREADRDVCVWHDLCHETVARHEEALIDMKKNKLDSWVFKLLVSTGIPLALALGGWIAVHSFETVKIVTKLDTNQQRLMQEFSIKPVKE